MLHPKKFTRKTTKFERWAQRAPEMAKIWAETELESRPEKYLDCGLDLLRTPEPLRIEIKNLYYELKPHFAGLRGGAHPIPEIAGLVYLSYKKTIYPLKRERIASIFGTNIDVITKAYKELNSFYISQQLSKNNLIVKCPRCFEPMNLDNSFWKCRNEHSQFAYQISRSFIHINEKNLPKSTLNNFGFLEVLPFPP